MATMKKKLGQQDSIPEDSISTSQEDRNAELVDKSDVLIEADPIDLEGDVPDTESAVEGSYAGSPSAQGSPSRSPSSVNDNAALARGLTGATPALLGLLFGASAATATDQVDQGKKYYEGGTPKKVNIIKGPNGEPIYSDIRDSVGKEAWQKPGKVGAGAGYSPITYKNEQGLEAIGRFNKSTGQVEQPNTGTPVEGAVKYQAPTFKEVTDEQGNKKIISIGPTSNVSNVAGVAKGLGTKYRLREDEVKQGDEYATKYIQDSKPIQESKASLKGAMNLLNSPDKDAVTQAAGIFRTAKAIVNERISDQERGFVTAPPGIFEKINQKIETIATSQNPQEQLRQLRAVLVELDNANDIALNSLQDRYVRIYSAGDKNKAKYLSDKIVSASDINVSQSMPAQKGRDPWHKNMTDADLDKKLELLKREKGVRP